MPRLPDMLGGISALAVGVYGLLTDVRSSLEEEYQKSRGVVKHFAQSVREQGGGALRLQYGSRPVQITVDEHNVYVPTLSWLGLRFASKPYWATRHLHWPDTLRQVRWTPLTARLRHAQEALRRHWDDYERSARNPERIVEGFEESPHESTRANAARVAAHSLGKWRAAIWIRRGVLTAVVTAIISGSLAVIILLLP